jgi:hypothetical protein
LLTTTCLAQTARQDTTFTDVRIAIPADIITLNPNLVQNKGY